MSSKVLFSAEDFRDFVATENMSDALSEKIKSMSDDEIVYLVDDFVDYDQILNSLTRAYARAFDELASTVEEEQWCITVSMLYDYKSDIIQHAYCYVEVSFFEVLSKNLIMIGNNQLPERKQLIPNTAATRRYGIACLFVSDVIER